MEIASILEVRSGGFQRASIIPRLTVSWRNLKVPARMHRHGWEYRLLPKELGRCHVMIANGFAVAVRAACVWPGRRVLGGSAHPAFAQDDVRAEIQVAAAGAADEEPGPETKGKKTVRLDEIDAPALQLTQIPVNPNDPILKVNGQIITRQQLADECIARKGKEIAELMINRTLVEQGCEAKRLEVTAAEIDQEIQTVAKRFGISREGWLRTLDKERKISPIQYARDIIYPASRCGN